jgi:NAD(P)-dependent dehydrogenase (short-subunit alcohol dehydrogenase family)
LSSAIEPAQKIRGALVIFERRFGNIKRGSKRWFAPRARRTRSFVFLASDESSFTTGAEFMVDGDLTAQ